MEALISDDWYSLADFVEATTPIKLDPWQVHLSERLQKLRWQKGQRILVHAPPQFGKSIIVSQRLPAWYLGYNPTQRVKLACYNITHATKFGRVVREIMRSREYSKIFPSPELRLPSVVSADEWSVPARLKLGDAQPSFGALGLLTGFVGQGADLLLIDDPYSSPQDANSPAVRKSVWTFWDESARVRINDQTNVVVMFHRYREDDLAGQLLEEGGWELLRYAAVADGDYLGFPDPMGRDIGEKLSPRVSEAFIEQQQKSGYAWQGQFQGRPSPKEGSFFKVAEMEIVEQVPANMRTVRAYDIAATAGGGDYTAGLKMGTRGDGIFYITDLLHGQMATDERDKSILQMARLDGINTKIRLPQDPGAAGKSQAAAFIRLLTGFAVRVAPVSGSKETRADPFSSQVNVGNVKLLRGNWNKALIEQFRQFPMGKDDIVDAASDAFDELSKNVSTESIFSTSTRSYR